MSVTTPDGMACASTARSTGVDGVSTLEGAEELLLRLLLSATPSERDLLLLLGDGDSPEMAAQRLGLTPSALAVRLHRLRRRAATLDL